MAIGVALIGGGIWAKEEHAPAIQASDDLDLKAIYSRSLKSAQDVAESVGKEIDLYSDDSSHQYQDILQREDIKAVIIGLPIANQVPYIRDALSAGKHVLSEKPVAENVTDAEALIKWYQENRLTNKATWSVAENWRYLNSFRYAREQIQKFGRVTGFRVRVYDNIKQEWKFFQTGWRKAPTHQGGFLLDSGVHYIAGLRYLLGTENNITRVSAFTNSLKDHLPPVDTMDAILKANSGIQGTFQSSVATTLSGPEWTVGCEKGSVTVADSVVAVRTLDGKETFQNVPDERTGVPPEIRFWGQAIASGRQNLEQVPEEALADLELVELMLRSGENEGQPQVCKHQILGE